MAFKRCLYQYKLLYFIQLTSPILDSSQKVFLWILLLWFDCEPLELITRLFWNDGGPSVWPGLSHSRPKCRPKIHRGLKILPGLIIIWSPKMSYLVGKWNLLCCFIVIIYVQCHDFVEYLLWSFCKNYVTDKVHVFPFGFKRSLCYQFQVDEISAL